MGNEKGREHTSQALGRRSFAASGSPRFEGRILCIGGAAVDTTLVALETIVAGTSNPAAGSRSFGGVARNVTENLARLGVVTKLVTCVGADENGRRLKRRMEELGVDVESVRSIPQGRTAEYVAVLEPERTLAVGVADMAIFDTLDAGLLDEAVARFDAAWTFADCNCAPDLLAALLDSSALALGGVAIDAVSVAKAKRLPPRLDGIALLFLNLDEAASVLDWPRAGLRPEAAIAGLHTKGAKSIVLTLGADGLLASEASAVTTHVPAVAAVVADVTGAGDALVAATLAALLAGSSLPDAARWGCLAASLTLERVGSTCPDLSFTLLRDQADQAGIAFDGVLD